MRRLLVTGANGFLGRHVSRHFAERGWQVSGIGHGNWDKGEYREWGLSEWHASDISLDALLTYGKNPELIIHCAGGGSVAYSVTNPYQDYQRTVATTAALLEFVRIHAPRARVLYPSSAAVYGLVDRLPIAETVTPNPVSPYGFHKLAAEELCRLYRMQFGLSVAVVRLFSVYGPGLRKQLLWDACNRLSHTDNSCFFGTGTETRDWLHVYDAAELFEVVAANSSADPVVNGGTGCGVSVQQILNLISDCFHCREDICFSGTERPGDPTALIADIHRACALGWSPRMDWQEGVRGYVNWYRSELG